MARPADTYRAARRNLWRAHGGGRRDWVNYHLPAMPKPTTLKAVPQGRGLWKGVPNG